MNPHNQRVLYKYEATGNDFFLCGDGLRVPDYYPEQVAQLCDRHFGFGADGLIRAVLVDNQQAQLLSSSDWETRALTGAELGEYTYSSLVTKDSDETSKNSNFIATYAYNAQLMWFMDYFNADGSIAQMCGNGVRAFAAYLENRGLCVFDEKNPTPIATRGGIKYVRKIDGNYQVQMGRPRIYQVDSHCLHTNLGKFTCSYVEMPNPHVVALLADEASLMRVHLPQNTARQLEVLPRLISGTNVELITVNPELSQIRMRVSERGVGETLSCGTGCCAAGYYAYRLFPKCRLWDIHIPGGCVKVEIKENGGLLLTGPARLIGQVISGV